MANSQNNSPASFRQRLLNLARDTGQAFDVVLVTYGLERLIYRLSISEHRDSFVLKGGMLVTLWIGDENRVTRDADILGFGDASIAPGLTIEYPTLLDMPAISIRAYPPASVVAEKFHAIVTLGLVNSRMKDYYDLWAILNSQTIDENELADAIAATFSRRETEIPAIVPPGLTDQFTAELQKTQQWATYTASIGLEGLSLDNAIDFIWNKLALACEQLQR
jgi:predicted nucleotidyltransferase component of viral defense system